MLHLEVLGRLGWQAFGRTYVVPITYAYDRRAIYSYSFEGPSFA
jgi:nitroimidazol reductase NimA-like FMN-containing flavoprotein (pyridoxamine 5'-phosphate oxidase superfamily)